MCSKVTCFSSPIVMDVRLRVFLRYLRWLWYSNYPTRVVVIVTLGPILPPLFYQYKFFYNLRNGSVADFDSEPTLIDLLTFNSLPDGTVQCSGFLDSSSVTFARTSRAGSWETPSCYFLIRSQRFRIRKELCYRCASF